MRSLSLTGCERCLGESQLLFDLGWPHEVRVARHTDTTVRLSEVRHGGGVQGTGVRRRHCLCQTDREIGGEEAEGWRVGWMDGEMHGARDGDRDGEWEAEKTEERVQDGAG